MAIKHNISILYLGKRGGGAQLALELSKQLSSSSNFQLQCVAIRKDNEIRSNFDQRKTISLFNSGLSLQALLKICEFLLHPQKLLDNLKIRRGEVCLIPMISPVGLIIEGILKWKGIYVLRFLHDAQRHPGDIWPTTRTIKRIVGNSKFLLALSGNVAEQILALNPKVEVEIYQHPVFNFIEEHDQLKLPKQYYLFLGRIRKYKGLPVLIEAFRMMKEERISLVVAGEGRVFDKLPDDALLLNSWLKEREISELIRRATVVCFPYIESSQSGLIPYCISKNKIIVITPNKGLVEQVGKYPYVVIANGNSAKDLKSAMESALKITIAASSHSTFNEGSIEDCLLKSPYFVK